MKRYIFPAIAGTAMLALTACGGEPQEATSSDAPAAQEPATTQVSMTTPSAGDGTTMGNPAPDASATPAPEKTDSGM
ncbi:hypothetical protein GRI39_07865 [Altererythrobacter indicus]|uniref:Uncharacterized protein n=1 Tax=Altericroceibacterium indicum TaxID=374177 RepID=A0A845A8W3_9SPHN|nr:hypothetical protein [Altericroceibacterium indicum]MXP25957.1 hypothetical protein [Altericroceibacterium indicum]